MIYRMRNEIQSKSLEFNNQRKNKVQNPSKSLLFREERKQKNRMSQPPFAKLIKSRQNKWRTVVLPTHGHPCVSGVGTVQTHGRVFNRAQPLASRHGRAYPATDRAPPAISRAPPEGSPGLHRCFVHVGNWSQGVLSRQNKQETPTF